MEVVRKNPKIFVGYSDVTPLHMPFNRCAGLVTFHGPTVSSGIVGNFDEESRNALFGALNGDNEYEFKNPEIFPIEVMKKGSAEGIITTNRKSLYFQGG